ncbi:285_t:CDS:2, partial [Cetraspora pellucida]
SEGTNVPKPTMNEQSEKNSKTRLPPMKLFLMDMDKATKHASSRCIGHPAMSWPFAKLVTEKSGTVCGYHPDEPKWAFVRYMYGIIASNPRASYYENIRFSYISPEKIHSVKSFFPKRSTVIIFEDLCVAPESIQNRIIPFFTHRHHRNISPIFITQKYHHVPMIIHENLSHILMFNGGSSPQDVSKIVSQYTDDVKSASMVINSYLCKNEFIVFDLNRAEDNPLAIRLRFDTLLDLQKEIELR